MTLEKKFKENTEALALFCLLSVDRMLPIFNAFEEKYSIEPTLNSLIEILYASLHGPTVNLKDVREKLDALIPDTEDYSDVLVDQAQCAAIGIYYAVEYLERFEVQSLEHALQKVDESIDIYGFEGGNELDAERNEKNWQENLAEILIDKTILDEVTIKKLRTENQKHTIPVAQS